MVRLISISALCLVGMLALASDAAATCWYECSLTPVFDDCSVAPELGEDVYEWDDRDEIRFLAACNEGCCAPDGSCSEPSPTEPPTGSMYLVDANRSLVDASFTAEEACGGTVVTASASLELHGRYRVEIDSMTELEFEVVRNASGCRVGGVGSSLGATGLLLLLLCVAGRRRR